MKKFQKKNYPCVPWTMRCTDNCRKIIRFRNTTRLYLLWKSSNSKRCKGSTPEYLFRVNCILRVFFSIFETQDYIHTYIYIVKHVLSKRKTNNSKHKYFLKSKMRFLKIFIFYTQIRFILSWWRSFEAVMILMWRML